MSYYQWYTPEHPLHRLVYMSKLEENIILNPPVLHNIYVSLPRYFFHLGRDGWLGIQMRPNLYHSLYDECIINKNIHVLEHIKQCPPIIIHYIVYSMLKEQHARRRLAAAI